MKEYRMLEAVGNIRPEFIEEGLAGTGRQRRKGERVFLRAAAAIVLICLSLSGIGALAAPDYVKGIFRDIFGSRGEVTGTAYEARAEELEISAFLDGGKLIILLKAADAGALPWKDLETIGLVKYSVRDGSGRELIGEEDLTCREAQDFREGTARIEAAADPALDGPCTLTIEALEGRKKADAPLSIRGRWECRIETAGRKTETEP